MNRVDYVRLKKLISGLPKPQSLEKHFYRFCRMYSKDIKMELPDQILKRVQTINQPKNKKKSTTNSLQASGTDQETEMTSFFFQEYKVFVWASVIICLKHQCGFENFSEDSYRELYSIFKTKTQIFVRYKIKCLEKDKIKGAKWKEEEITLLRELVSLNCSWKQVSFQMFKISKEKIFRKFQDCRQMWINHLDPFIKKGGWKTEEDYIIMTQVELYGKVWASISQILPNTRNQHQVKNRHNALVKKYSKIFPNQRQNYQNFLAKILKDLQKKIKKQTQQSETLINQPKKTQDMSSEMEKNFEEKQINVQILTFTFQNMEIQQSKQNQSKQNTHEVNKKFKLPQYQLTQVIINKQMQEQMSQFDQVCESEKKTEQPSTNGTEGNQSLKYQDCIQQKNFLIQKDLQNDFNLEDLHDLSDKGINYEPQLMSYDDIEYENSQDRFDEELK